MQRNRLAALIGLSLLAGFGIFMLVPPHVETMENGQFPPEEPRPEPGSRTPEPAEHDEPAPLSPARSSGFGSQAEWTIVSTIEERLEPAAAQSPYFLRRRLVVAKEMDRPVVLEELLDPADADALPVLFSSYLPNRLIISDGQSARRLLHSPGPADQWRIVGPLGESGYLLLETDDYDLDTVATAIEEIAHLAPSLEPEKDVLYYATSSARPNDPDFASGLQWGLENPSGGGDINAVAGWGIRSDASSSIIAIVDTGINLEHQDLKPNLWKNAGEIAGNDRDDDGNGYIDDVYGINLLNPLGAPEDDAGHGTHVAGIAGAVGNDALGIAGVCWNARLMPIKFLNRDGRGTLSDAIKAIDYAAKMGAHVINASWGGYDQSLALEKTIRHSGESGSAFVTSAGNDGYDLNAAFPYPASYDIDSLITVASIGKDGQFAWFSNHGTRTVSVAAPGVDIYSTWIGGKDAYSIASGTSMAAPHVSGTLALLRSQFPDDSPAMQIRRLELSGRELPSLAQMTRTGRIPDLAAALAMVEVPIAPELSTEIAQTLYRNLHDELTLSVHDRNGDLVETTYQWRLNGSPIAGASFPELPLVASAESAGRYVLTATNEFGSDSLDFALHVFAPAPDLASDLDFPEGRFFAYSNHDWSSTADTTALGGSALAKPLSETGTERSLGLQVEGPGQLRFSHQHFTRFRDAQLEVSQRSGTTSVTVGHRWERSLVEVDTTGVQMLDFLMDAFFAMRLGEGGRVALDSFKFYPKGRYPPFVGRYEGGIGYSEGDTAQLKFEVLFDADSYVWIKDGAEIATTDEPLLVLEDVTKAAEGNYVLVASNQYGSDRSVSITIEVSQGPPRFTYSSNHDFSVEVNEGGRLTLAPEYSGSDELVFQWYRYQAPTEGANSPTLSFDPATPYDHGPHQLVIRDPETGESATGPRYWVTVRPAGARPHIDLYSSLLVQVPIGGPILLQPELQGSVPMTYQWYRDNRAIPEATGPDLAIEEAARSDEGAYYLIANNEFGTAKSQEVTYTVFDPHFELAEPLDSNVDWTINYAPAIKLEKGEAFHNGSALRVERRSPETASVALGIVATFPGSGVLRLSAFAALASDYSREHNLEIRIDGMILGKLYLEEGWRHLSFPIAGDEEHVVEIRLDGENVDHFLLDNVTIDSAPYIFAHPNDAVASVGQDVTLSAQIVGDSVGATLQWHKDGAPIEGATAIDYTIMGVSRSDEGAYHLALKAGEAQLESETAELRVYEDLGSHLGVDGIEILSAGTFGWSLLDDEKTLSSGTSPAQYRNWIDFTMEGPGYFTFEASQSKGSNSVIYIDEGYYNTIIFEAWQLFSLALPEGEHTVRLAASSEPQISAQLRVRNLQFELQPSFIEHPRSLTITPETDEELSATIASGSMEISFLWYRDGTPIEPDGRYRSQFGEVAILRLGKDGGREAGEYHCEATLPDGTTIASEIATVRRLDDSLSAIGIDGSHISMRSAYTLDPRLDFETYRSTAPSLLFDRNTAFSLGTNSSGTLSFWAKAEGLSDENYLSIDSAYGDTYRTRLTESFDWKRFEIPIEAFEGAASIAVWARLLDEGESSVWIQDVKFSSAPAFLKHPEKIQTQLGKTARLSAEVLSDTSVSYRWLKDSTVIPGAVSSTLDLGPIEIGDLGIYQLIATNSSGSTASRPAELELLNGLGLAVEAPYVSISTGGSVPWRIDTAQWLYNGSSIVSGPVGFGESSFIEFDVQGPAEVGFFAKGGDAAISVDGQSSGFVNSLARQWSFHSLKIDQSGPVRVRIAVMSGQMRIDRLSLRRHTFGKYRDWLRSEVKSLPSRTTSGRLSPYEDIDGDGILNIWKYLVVSTAEAPKGPPPLTLQTAHGVSQLAVTARVRLDMEYYLMLEASDDLINWRAIDPVYLDDDLAGPTEQTMQWMLRPNADSPIFHRWKAAGPEQVGGF